jgi:hypothetical protein
MKQALLSLIRRPLRATAPLGAPAVGMRELDRSALRLVAGGNTQAPTENTESPRTGW